MTSFMFSCIVLNKSTREGTALCTCIVAIIIEYAYEKDEGLVNTLSSTLLYPYVEIALGAKYY